MSPMDPWSICVTEEWDQPMREYIEAIRSGKGRWTGGSGGTVPEGWFVSIYGEQVAV